MVFRFSGVDQFSFFEKILQLDTESAEKLGGDIFSPVDTDSSGERTAADIDSFEVLKYRRR